MALEYTHNMFVSRKMEADYVGTDLATVSFSTDKDNGALCVLGNAVSSSVFNQTLDMNHYNGQNPANVKTDSIYVVDSADVFQCSGADGFQIRQRLHINTPPKIDFISSSSASFSHAATEGSLNGMSLPRAARTSLVSKVPSP